MPTRCPLLVLALLARAPSGRAAAAVAVLGDAGCARICEGSCCYFSDGGLSDCAACGTSVVCNPAAECYGTGSKGAPVDGATNSDCMPYCSGAQNCCTFSDPKQDCSACGAGDGGCNPAAECYASGMPAKREL